MTPMQLRDAEAWLADVAEKMSAVVDSAFRAVLTGQYLALLQEWHSYPANRREALTPAFALKVQRLDEQVTAGMIQYKLQPGLGDLQDGVRQALVQAMESFHRLKALAGRQRDLPTRRRWEARLNGLAEQLRRVDDELSYAPHSTAFLSRLDAMANRVNNLVAVEMLPLELQWSRSLGLKPPKFLVGQSARSGAVSFQIQPEIWKGGAGAYPLADAAQDTLTAYNKAVTSAWATESEAVGRAAQVSMGRFSAAVGELNRLKARLNRQAQWLTVNGEKRPDRSEGWSADLNERITVFNSLAAEARALADQMKQVSYNQFDQPEQVVQKMLGGDLPRDSAAVALLFDPQIREFAGQAANAVRGADAFDADAGIRTR